MSKSELFPFQEIGVKFLIEKGRAMLCDDMGCVSGDTLLNINFGGAGKQVTMREFYHRYGRYNTSIRCRAMCDGELRQHEVKKIIYQGEKSVVKITLQSGKTIRLTPDHEVSCPGDLWIPAQDLKPGDEVWTNGTPVCLSCGGTNNVSQYPYAKFKGYCRSCIYKNFRKVHNAKGGHLDKDGYKKIYKPEHPRAGKDKTVFEHILVMEEYLGRPIGTDEQIHHINEDRQDNRIENLEVLTVSEHHKKHHRHLNMEGGRNRVCFIPKRDTVISVEPDGITDVYDLVMADPYRNFVANGIVVANCGKTVQAIEAVKRLRLTQILVVCPNSLKRNWANEIERWYPGAPITVLDGGKELRVEQVESFTRGFLITNYESIRSSTARIGTSGGGAKTHEYNKLLDAILKTKWHCMIFDEAHRFKNRKAKQTAGVFKLSQKSAYCYLLTGTPVQNRGMEIWPLLHALDQKKYSSYWNFAKKYFAARPTDSSMREWIVAESPTNPEVFRKEVLQPVFLKRTKEAVLPDLPEKRFLQYWVDLEGEQKKIYQKMEKEFLSQFEQDFKIVNRKSGDVEETGKEAVEIMAFNVITQILRLKQICVAPEIMTTNVKQNFPSAKIDLASEFIEEAAEQNEKIVVFSQFEKAISLMHDKLKTEGIYSVRYTGKENLRERDEAIKEFQSNPTCRAILLTYAAGGEGITLTASNTVILLDKAWNPAVISQAIDRVHRIGQERQVTVYEILATNSIEEWIEEKLAGKDKTIQDITGIIQNKLLEKRGKDQLVMA